jgi:hypothetical protein
MTRVRQPRDPRLEISSEPPPEQLTDREILLRTANQVGQMYQADIPEIKGELVNVGGRVAQLEHGFGALERRVDRVAVDVVKLNDAVFDQQKGVVAVQLASPAKVKTPVSVPPISIPAARVELQTGQFKSLAHDKDAMEALIAARATQLATEEVDKRVQAALEQHDIEREAKQLRTIRAGGWHLALGAAGLIIAIFLALLGGALLQQAHDQGIKVEAQHHP